MDFSIDYVYEATDSQEFKNVRIQVYPDPDGELIAIDIISAEEIEISDLKNILNSLWKQRFARLRLNPVNDCRIQLIVADVVYDVPVSQQIDGISIDGLLKNGQ